MNTTITTNESETITTDEALAQILAMIESRYSSYETMYNNTDSQRGRDKYQQKINEMAAVLYEAREIAGKVR